MSIEQIIILAAVQGIAEFLPISSSAHLILVPHFTGWPDQGLITDVMMHLGSLGAVLVYFWRDVLRLLQGGWGLIRGHVGPDGLLAFYIVAATIPAVIFGLVLKSTGLIDQIRSIEIVAWNAIIFGVLMLAADWFGPRLRVMEDMRFSQAIVIGLAQAVALIPGASRSGVTMTAARALGFERAEAARFSFLLGIPAIVGAGLLTTMDALDQGGGIPTDALIAAGLTFFSALAAIAFLMALLRWVSFLPFVLYRLALGGFLLFLAYGG